VGLSHRAHNKLQQLSGGEQQRVAIAIALANQPKILLADEPTGSVDSRMAAQILDLFRELNKTLGLTVIIVTHDPEVARNVDRVVAIRDGKISSEMLRTKSYLEELEEIAAGRATEVQAHTEYAVLDKAGRLQVPAAYLDTEGFKDQRRVRVEMEDGKIILSPPE